MAGDSRRRIVWNVAVTMGVVIPLTAEVTVAQVVIEERVEIDDALGKAAGVDSLFPEPACATWELYGYSPCDYLIISGGGRLVGRYGWARDYEPVAQFEEPEFSRARHYSLLAAESQKAGRAFSDHFCSWDRYALERTTTEGRKGACRGEAPMHRGEDGRTTTDRSSDTGHEDCL